MPQVPEFLVDTEPICVAPYIAERLAAALYQRGTEHARSAATKIREAMERFTTATIDVRIGEDTELLAVIPKVRAEGYNPITLDRLERALRARLVRETA